jgi:hypothetical protein
MLDIRHAIASLLKLGNTHSQKKGHGLGITGARTATPSSITPDKGKVCLF